MNWYRVEVSRDGSIVSCREVDYSIDNTNGKRVFYIEAMSEVMAKQIARDQAVLKNGQARYSTVRSKSLCVKCLRPTDGVALCEKCKSPALTPQQRQRRAEREAAARSGSPLPFKAHQNRATGAGSLRIKVLRDVQRELSTHGDLAAFASWLADEISRLESLRADHADARKLMGLTEDKARVA